MNIHNQPILGHAAFHPNRHHGYWSFGEWFDYDPETALPPEVLRKIAERSKTKRTKLLKLRRVGR